MIVFLKNYKIQIIIMLLLILGLIAGVFLVRRQQTIKSKANSEIINSFEIKDSQGNQINCNGTNCETQNLDVQIKVRDLPGLIPN